MLSLPQVAVSRIDKAVGRCHLELVRLG